MLSRTECIAWIGIGIGIESNLACIIPNPPRRRFALPSIPSLPLPRHISRQYRDRGCFFGFCVVYLGFAWGMGLGFALGMGIWDINRGCGGG